MHPHPESSKRRLWAHATVAAALAVACEPVESREADPRVGWVADVEQPMPAFLSETGLYADLPTLSPGPGARPYVPAHPLWSNGADKDRLLFLPPGARIEPSDDAAVEWTFPVGTVLVKSFAFDDVEGRDGPVTLETRVLARRSGGWVYALYHWDAAGTEAALSGEDWRAESLALEDASGARFAYTLPGKLDCRSCHETPGLTPVLGISRWQQPEALAAEAEHVYVTAPPAADVAAVATSAVEALAMSYLVGNCAFCHSGRDTGENSAFALTPDVLRENTIDRETDSSASGIGIRVVPGEPEASALYEAVVLARRPGYRGDFKPMPPAGIDRVDPRVEQVLRRWILSLEPNDAP